MPALPPTVASAAPARCNEQLSLLADDVDLMCTKRVAEGSGGENFADDAAGEPDLRVMPRAKNKPQFSGQAEKHRHLHQRGRGGPVRLF
jgi:hypothetical protein